MRLTTIGKLVVFGTVALYAIAVMNDSPPVYVLGSAGVALLAACHLLGRRALHGLRATAEAPGRTAAAGGALLLRVRLENGCAHPRGPLRIRAESQNRTLELPPVADERALSSLWPGEEVAFSLSFPCPARGWYAMSPVEISASDPLGLFSQQLLVGKAAELLALPRADHWTGVDTGVFARRRQGRRRAARAGEGLEFHGVREYQPGDELRRVHWPTTARLGRLAIRELEQTWSGTAAVVLDLDRRVVRGKGLDSTTETVIYAGASLVHTVLETGGSCLLLARGDRRVAHPPERGDAHEHRLLVDLADVRATGPLRFDEFLRTETRALPPGCLVFLVSPSRDLSLVRAVAYLHGHATHVYVSLVSGPGGSGADAQAEARLAQALRAVGATVRALPAGAALPGGEPARGRPDLGLAVGGGGG